MNKARFLLVTFVALFISMQAFADIQIFKNENKGTYGWQDENGKVLVKPKYDDALLLPNSYVLVKKRNLYGIANSTGKEIIATLFYSMYNFNKGGDPYIILWSDYLREGFIFNPCNSSSNVSTKIDHFMELACPVESYKNFCVTPKNSNHSYYFHVDKATNNLQFGTISDYTSCDDYEFYQYDNISGNNIIVNKAGKTVMSAKGDIRKEDKHWYVGVDYIFDPIGKQFYKLNHGYHSISYCINIDKSLKKRYCLLDKFDEVYEKMIVVSDDLDLAVYNDSVWSVFVYVGREKEKISFKGEPDQCSFMDQFYKNDDMLLKVRTNGKVGVIKPDYTVVVPVKYDDVKQIGNEPCDLFQVEEDGKSSLYSVKLKKTLLPFDEYSMGSVCERINASHYIYSVTNSSGKKAFFGNAGNKIADFGVYTSFFANYEKFLIVEKSGKYGAISYSGRVVIPFIHNAPGASSYLNGNYMFEDELSNGTGYKAYVYSKDGALLTTKIIYNNQPLTKASFDRKWMGY
jgi:hypothetical protein